MVVETLIGVYWNYYELLDMDGSMLGKVSVVIVADGLDWLHKDFLTKAKKAGIYIGDDP